MEGFRSGQKELIKHRRTEKLQTGPWLQLVGSKAGMTPTFLLGPNILAPKPALGGEVERVVLG